jgi:hypothetical protein
MKPVIAPEVFIVGRHFRVKKSFMSGPGHFVAGEMLQFEHFGYSPYDGAYVYTFRSEADGRTTHWLISDELGQKETGAPLPDWKEFFDPVVG